MKARAIIEWVTEPPRRLCRHNWKTVKTEERPGYCTITQECPHCQKQRVLDRRILPPLPRKPMTERPPKATGAASLARAWRGIRVSPPDALP